LQHTERAGLLYILHIKQPNEAVDMNKLSKTLCVTAFAGAIAIPFTAAQAWWGGGPWGGGGPWNSGWGNNGMGDGWGDGSGDFDFNMSGGGHGSGYGRGYGRGYGYGNGYGYGGYPYGGWGGPYGYGGYPGAYGAPYGYAPPVAAPAQPAAPETSK
jgi:hypothetical protein